MIHRNPTPLILNQARREARQLVQSASANQGATGSSGPVTQMTVAVNDATTGEMVNYGILGVTLAGAGPFRLKDG